MDLKSSHSLPAKLQAASEEPSQLKSSASVQTRIYSTISKHRSRNPGHLSGSENGSSPSLHGVDANASLHWRNVLYNWVSAVCLLFETQAVRQRLSHNPRFRYSLVVYACLSLLFLSSALVTRLLPEDSAPRDDPHVPHIISPIQDLPTEHLLSKLTSLYPQPSFLDPYILRAEANKDAITACLWTDAENINLLPSWASRWKGYISLLVTTPSSRSSKEYGALLEKIANLQKITALNSTVSVHLLHLPSNAPDNPNAFLNLARVFSQTPRVALFPGNLSVVPPKTFYRSFFPEASPEKPLIFSSRGRMTYPFSALSPLVIARDNPLWCTERFFPSISRATDWSECLWQVWLETFGNTEVKPTTEWVQIAAASESSLTEMKFRHRLSAKYRSETCVLATRQLAALRTVERNIHATKARWLKRNCR